MVQKINVFYEGWGERFHWGTLATGRGAPMIFEYTTQALQRGLEMSPHQMPLTSAPFVDRFPVHQHRLPGPIYDALPDGWGMLLMDRLFKKRNLRGYTVLDRLAYIAETALGALTFEPAALVGEAEQDIPLEALARETQKVLQDKDSDLLPQLVKMGGSPGGARPKALVYRKPGTDTLSTVAQEGWDAWLVKFPAKDEHKEVCALEEIYAQVSRNCGIDTPDTLHLDLSRKLAAFATKRFDREGSLRVPVHSLAGVTGADFKVPGSLSYEGLLRATWVQTRSMEEVRKAFKRCVFNVILNNRDDHPKNFAFTMRQSGAWVLAPAYDITYCEGPGGEHQMDVMGEGFLVTSKNLLALAAVMNIAPQEVADMVEEVATQAVALGALAKSMLPPKAIRGATLKVVTSKIDENIAALKA